MEQEKYSFSRLETFHNCRRLYYYNYVEKNRSGDNIYSYLGTVVHELTQGMEQGLETNETAVKKFIEAVDDADMLDLSWMSENVKDKYVECITHFLENYKPTNNNTIRIEDYFEIDINGIILRGYIDLWYRIGKDIYIIDLKTSTKFTKKDLPKKSRQLLLYGIHMSEKYPDYNIILQFNMLKYVLRNGKLVERTKVDIFDEFEDGIVNVEYTEEGVNEVIDYVSNTVKEINETDKTNISHWPMDNDPNKDFFCRNLCTYRETCLSNK